jgi:hypothetical protein
MTSHIKWTTIAFNTISKVLRYYPKDLCTSLSFNTSPNLRKNLVASCMHNSGATILLLGFSNGLGKQEGAVK